jgi:hypothetical protein
MMAWASRRLTTTRAQGKISAGNFASLTAQVKASGNQGLQCPRNDLFMGELLALIKCQFHVPTYQVNVWNNDVFTLSTNLVPQL